MKTSTTYNREFWNSIKKGGAYSPELREGFNSETGSHYLPSESTDKFNVALAKENLFRRFATVKQATTRDGSIWITPSNANVDWIGDNGEIPALALQTLKLEITSHKLAGISTIKNDFIKDTNFDIEKHITTEFARCFGTVEENALINGDGVDKPIGILHSTNGADIGVTSPSITIFFDDVIKLFFSVKSEYRTKGMWLINDEMAQHLLSLKDDSGNYLWRGSSDTLLGKPVVISNHMPSAASGAKPIAFGDFSYYWVVQRQPLSIKVLSEMYMLNDEVGYIGFERLDGKLIVTDSIKVLQVA